MLSNILQIQFDVTKHLNDKYGLLEFTNTPNLSCNNFFTYDYKNSHVMRLALNTSEEKHKTLDVNMVNKISTHNLHE